MKLLISCLLALFAMMPKCYSQENNLIGKFYGSRKGASYSLDCTAHNNGLYTLSGIVTYSSDGRGYRPSDSHYAYGGRERVIRLDLQDIVMEILKKKIYPFLKMRKQNVNYTTKKRPGNII